MTPVVDWPHRLFQKVGALRPQRGRVRFAGADRLAFTLAIGAVLVVASCSLPVDGEVQPLDPNEYSDVVFGMETTTTTIPPDDLSPRIRLFFYSDQGLESVFRPLVDPKIPEILDALQDGPIEEDLAQMPGLRTELPAGLNPTPRPREVGAQTLIVDVDDEGGLRTLPSENPQRAEFVYTQIVCTMTNLNLLSGVPITGVEFHDSEGRIQIVDANRSPIEGRAARASDFNDCVTVTELLEEQADAEETDEPTTTTGG